MKSRQHDRSGRSSRRGATAVEFAFVAPIIFLLFLGSIEMTNLNTIRHTASNAAYEGARQTIVAGGTADAARQEVTRLLGIVNVGNQAQCDVTELPDRVTVTVRIPVQHNSWGLLRFCGNLTVVQACTLKREMVQQT
jgi:Flp pilus assembly protein TadG